VIRAIEPAVRVNLSVLVPIDRAWQPTDYLPDLEAENCCEEIERFRHTAEAISDELLVVLVGDMVTEANWLREMRQHGEEAVTLEEANANVVLLEKRSGGF
jgi:Fatty acid desaturase